MTRSENEVDQIVFRWDSENLSGSTGFGPVAWSGPRDEAESLYRTSGTVLRASGEETRPALIRLQRRSEVMLIRRTPFKDADGGTSVLCHALVGSPELLEPATCLGLHAWDWEGADVDTAHVRGRLPAIPEELLVPATGRGQGELDRTLEGVAEELTGMVAELLRRPEERFTVLDARGDTACPVLWGLHSMFGTLTERRWTFATHDTVELPALRFVFVGRWAGAASRNTERRRVDPGERLGDRADETAARLVAHHLRGVEEGEGGLYAVGSALHAASSARRGSLLDTATRAVDALDRRSGGPSAGPATGQGAAGARPPVQVPRPPAADPARGPEPSDPRGSDPSGVPPETRRNPGRKWGRPLGGRAAEDTVPPPDGPPDTGAGAPRGAGRPGPSERPDLWFRPSPPEPEPSPPEPEPASGPDPDPYRSGRPGPDPRADPYRSGPPRSQPQPDVPDQRASSYERRPAEPRFPSPPGDLPAVRPAPSRGGGRTEPQPEPSPHPDPYRRLGTDPDPTPAPTPVPTPDPGPAPRPRPVDPPRRPDLSKPSAEPGDRPDSPGQGGGPPGGAGARAPECEGARDAPSHRPGADPYPRPVLPLVAPTWTGPGTLAGRPWATVRGRGREREAETGLVHKLPAARDEEEARELVERGGSRELLDALRRPQAYLVLTVLLRETARRVPSWERPLRRELCEVALDRELWAVAPPGGGADHSDPPEEQRAANAAALHGWAVRPLLGGGDAPVGTVAALLTRLRKGPEPSARETFWLIVDGERPGLPEAVWLTLLKEAYGVPRTAPRPGAPAPGAVPHPDDAGNGYTRRFLRRAGLLLGGLVGAILLVTLWEWFT
ncbi:hypothetical protein [Streptomyces sp. NPDC002057]|uniref:hypothetical protein n=1 Tax=Streptomyces sp. NPDC002057 TaxID=3154664 RepID=UPI0033307416